MKIDRLLSIIVLMLNRDRITALELARYFDTSIRTIYRDIDTLSIAGIPVVSHQGSSGGYSLLPNFKMDRQIFTSDELPALMTGLKGVESVFKNMTVFSTLEKVKALVPETVNADKTVIIDFSVFPGLIILFYRIKYFRNIILVKKFWIGNGDLHLLWNYTCVFRKKPGDACLAGFRKRVLSVILTVPWMSGFPVIKCKKR